MLSLPLFQSQCVFAQTDQAQSAIQAANTSVDQAFNAVLAAEKAGANVTSLLNQLNGAAGLLAQAENAYSISDNDTAIKDANAVLPIAQQVTVQARAAEQNASISTRNALWTTIAVVVVAVVVFVVVLFLVWRLFKRSHVEGLRHAKPEVASVESE